MATQSIIEIYKSQGSSTLRGKGPFDGKSPEAHPSSDPNSELHSQGAAGTRSMKADHSIYDLDGKEPKGYTVVDLNGVVDPV